MQCQRHRTTHTELSHRSRFGSFVRWPGWTQTIRTSSSSVSTVLCFQDSYYSGWNTVPACKGRLPTRWVHHRFVCRTGQSFSLNTTDYQIEAESLPILFKTPRTGTKYTTTATTQHWLTGYICWYENMHSAGDIRIQLRKTIKNIGQNKKTLGHAHPDSKLDQKTW